MVTLAEFFHELLESAGHFLALRHRSLEEMFVKLAHQPEAGPLIEEVEFGL